jgi:putative SOS response-associated peptidase YedK
MCSRFSLAEDIDFLAARLGVSAMALANYPPRYNIAPQEHFIVTTEYENRKLASAKWGLVFNLGKPAAPSIRSILKQKPRRAGQLSPSRSPSRRCVIPAKGFYE